MFRKKPKFNWVILHWNNVHFRVSVLSLLLNRFLIQCWRDSRDHPRAQTWQGLVTHATKWRPVGWSAFSSKLSQFFFFCGHNFQYSGLKINDTGKVWNVFQEETILIAGILLNLQSAENQTFWILKTGISRHQAHYFKFSPLILRQKAMLDKCVTLCFPQYALFLLNTKLILLRFPAEC